MFLFAHNPLGLDAQSADTIFTYKEYMGNLFMYHPIAKKANLQLNLAEAEMLGAKGNLDPAVFSDWNQKNFDDKLYYRQYQANIKLPTRLGIDVVGGYENTEGVFLNPENTTDDFGLWHLGLEVDILQGFFTNERNTAFKQAEVFQELAINERQIILNDLIYNATAAYFIWQQYAYFDEVVSENVAIANTYYANTRQSYISGEKTAIDTLEAFISYQDAIAQKQKNEMGLRNSRQFVENYLWFNNLPAALQENTRPENYQNSVLPTPKEFEDSALNSHPVILASINRLSFLEIEQKLKREYLKPKLKIKYNTLLATSSNNISPSLSINDYKWGFDFSMPLLFRSEKAAIQKGEVKIQATILDIQNNRNELLNKIENSWQQQLLLEEQIALLANNVENYKRLLDGENEKFNFGESSVFLLNKRQEKYINGQIKLIETYIKKQIELLNFLYYSNQLINE